MRRIICLLLIATVLLAGCSGEAGGNTDDDQKIETESNREDETMEPKTLLTVDELIEIAGIESGDYENDFLEKFIERYQVTESFAQIINIPVWLEEFDPDEPDPIDVSDILNSSGKPKRKSNFTEDAVIIAFHESSFWGNSCAYYDLENGLFYFSDDLDIFDDLNKAESKEFTDGEGLLKKLYALGAFSWKDMTTSEEILDGGFATFVVQYDDGSVFAVYFDNEFPKNYQEVKALLMNKN